MEARGLFIDAGSLPKSKEGIRSLLARLNSAKFNMLFPEVFRRGYTIYPSRYTTLDPDFDGKGDLFGFFMEEARRLGFEVHPWLWCFRVRSPGYGDPILSKLPALAARSSKTVEPRFLSPASPEARHLLGDIVEELVNRYQPDGVMMDYIRYDEETPEDWLSVTRFRLEGMERNGKYPETNDLAWQLWREEQVNSAVKEINKRLNATRKKPVLAAAVFRNERYARLTEMQNWRHWSNNRWIRWASPMLYTSKAEDLEAWLDWETDGFQRKNLLYPILGLHRMEAPDRNALEQLNELNRFHQGGALFFALAHLPLGMLEDLASGPYRNKAYPPHRNLIQAARRVLVEASNRYLGNLYRQADLDTAASALVLWQEVKKIENSIPFGELPFRENRDLLADLSRVDALARTMARDGHFPSSAAEELAHRFDYARELVKANAQSLETRYFPPNPPPKQNKILPPPKEDE